MCIASRIDWELSRRKRQSKLNLRCGNCSQKSSGLNTMIFSSRGGRISARHSRPGAPVARLASNASELGLKNRASLLTNVKALNTTNTTFYIRWYHVEIRENRRRELPVAGKGCWRAAEAERQTDLH